MTALSAHAGGEYLGNVVAVANALVRMPVRMRLAGRRGLVVVVAMVLVMHVSVRVLDRLVHVLMIVTLGDVQPDADHHQRRRHSQPGRQWLLEHDHTNQRAHEGRRREDALDVQEQGGFGSRST